MILNDYSSSLSDFAQKWLKTDKNNEKSELCYLPVYFHDPKSRKSVWHPTGMREINNRQLNDFKKLYNSLFQPFNLFRGSSTSLREMIALYGRMMTNWILMPGAKKIMSELLRDGKLCSGSLQACAGWNYIDSRMGFIYAWRPLLHRGWKNLNDAKHFRRAQKDSAQLKLSESPLLKMQ